MGTTQQAIMGLYRHLTPKLDKQGEYKCHYLNRNARTRKRDGTVAPTARPHPWVVNFYRILIISHHPRVPIMKEETFIENNKFRIFKKLLYTK